MAELHPDNPYAPERYPQSDKKPKFSDAAMQRFEYVLTRYPNKQAALLPTLHLGQEEWGGWIPPEGVLYIGELLDLAPSYVFGVLSFYNMYNQKPVGKYHLQVCTNLSCMLAKAYDIYDHLGEKLGAQGGKTTSDGLFTVTEVECLGSCGTAPVVQVNNDYHESMTVEKMDELLGRLK